MITWSKLSSVTSGVIGLTAEGRIDFLNPAATRILELDLGRAVGLDRQVERALLQPLVPDP